MKSTPFILFCFASLTAVMAADEAARLQTKTMTTAKPPVAQQRPFQSTHHGITIEDPWHWLRDPGYPKIKDKDILAYLKAENRYFEAHMKEQQPLVEKLFEEMKGRIQEDDSSVPQKDGDWIYWSTFTKGSQYRRHYRKLAAGGEEQLILDQNELAKGKDYFQLSDLVISPNGKLMAYAYDDDGSERFEVHFRDLTTGKELPDVIPGTLSSLVWSADSEGLVFGYANDNWRTDNIHYHRLGDAVKKAKLLYKEADIGFSCDADLSCQEDWIIIGTGDQVTSEVRLVPAANPTAEPILVSPRKVGREYDVDLRDGTLFIHTNDEHVNFRIATAVLEKPGEWKTLIPGSDRHYLTDIGLFKDFFVTEGRIDGLDQIEIRRYDAPLQPERIAFPEPSYAAGLSSNPEYAVTTLRIDYESMVTPATDYDYHVAEKRLETLKVQQIPSGYDASQYQTERILITARDGVQVPVSILTKKGFKKDGSQPLHLYAYGAYGMATPPDFSANRLSLVDRGFAYAIAHIRGGDDLGYQWYLDGKLMKRTNTFNDFVDAARGLIERGYTTKGLITASGGSAGGELMGAVVNQAPELFGAVVAHVPFVDVLNTMLDTELPLTPGEWPEWGNPITDKAAFEFIRSYSPYDNISAKAYPPMLVTGGLNDPRVTYWEPAKMVAKLRALKTDKNLLLLKINMGAGHGGKSGRYEHLHENAEEMAFILWQMDKSQ
jgi:oligopeptidase B